MGNETVFGCDLAERCYEYKFLFSMSVHSFILKPSTVTVKTSDVRRRKINITINTHMNKLIKFLQ